MKITNDRKLLEIQKEFSEMYPGLKIEFYSEEHTAHNTSPLTQLLDSSKHIGEVRDIHVNKELLIKPEQTVAYLENTFKEIFGLNVQIFRKSKELWLQTSTTDDWTLEKQNLKGVHSMQSNTFS